MDNRMNQDKTKLLALFSFLEELSKVQNKLIRDINEQIWSRSISSLPDNPDHIQVFYQDAEEQDEEDWGVVDDAEKPNVLLSVKDKEYKPCPAPAEYLMSWIDGKWEDYTKDVQPIESINGELFSDIPQRVSAFELWIEKRRAWQREQRETALIHTIYTDLHSIYMEMKRESERQELVVANGIIHAKSNPYVNHPILTKRVDIEFKPEIKQFNIIDTDNNPQLYEALLLDVAEVEKSFIPDLKKELEERFYHPLDRVALPKYFSEFSHKINANGEYVESPSVQTKPNTSIWIVNEPLFLMRKRVDGTTRSIQRIKEVIDREGNLSVPGFFTGITNPGLDQGNLDEEPEIKELSLTELLASACGEDKEILLAKEANREQLEIAQNIETSSSVVVQGPPGTGKTHTIANLIGHFLSEGKSVLVTSHTKKALRVLKGQVPENMQSLCVSLLDENNKDMQSSVDGIIDKMSTNTAEELRKKADKIALERESYRQDLENTRQRIYQNKCKDIGTIVLADGKAFNPIEAAQFVHDKAEALSYIPGRVAYPAQIPLSKKQLFDLYRSNSILDAETLSELNKDLPNPDTILNPAELSDLERKLGRFDQVMTQEADLLRIEISQNYLANTIYEKQNGDQTLLAKNITEEAAEALVSSLKSIHKPDGWEIDAVLAGKRKGAFIQPWNMLVDVAKDCYDFAAASYGLLFGKHIEFNDISNTSLESLKQLCNQFQKTGKVSKASILFNTGIKNAYNSVTINDHLLESAEDCESVIAFLSLKEKRDNLGTLWDELIGTKTNAVFETLGNTPEEICRKYVGQIEECLNWYDDVYAKTITQLQSFNTDVHHIFGYKNQETEYETLIRDIQGVCVLLPHYANIFNAFSKYKSLFEKRNKTIKALQTGAHASSVVCQQLVRAMNTANADPSYEDAYGRLCDLYNKYSSSFSREEYLRVIREAAPEWAAAIEDRKGIHGGEVCPDNIEEAWQWKQLNEALSQLSEYKYDDLIKKEDILSKKYRSLTAKLAETRAWYYLINKTTKDKSIQHALNSWKATVRKIGKGTGKNAPKYKLEAQKLMGTCQKAVPVWIMPISKAIDYFDPAVNRFDVIIVDEASQCDILSLPVVFMADRLIVVGDDQQVSPMSIGVDTEIVNELQANYLTENNIPAAHLFDLKTSLYDLACSVSKPLMLREHFRCVPDIIGFCNRLAYDYRIRPLRDGSTSPVLPAMVPMRVNGSQLGRAKRNEQEALTIVALIKACIEQKEYDGQTFGVISMLGDDQAKLIQQLLFQYIDAATIEERQILCGNSAQFQGDERDIVFLSLVSTSASDDNMLRIVNEGVGGSTKQRYNVAVSRAKNQLWIVYSFDEKTQLKNDDLRKNLLDYAQDPFNSNQLNRIEKKSESPFEKAVASSLAADGYNIQQQWKVGHYRLDIVVQYQDKKVAVECDGERYHSGEEKIREDMERQTILERVGWTFIRIRGSEYYRDPEGTMTRVKQELENMGILREEQSAVISNTTFKDTELSSNVKRSANEYLKEWTNKANVSHNWLDFEATSHTKVSAVTSPQKPQVSKPKQQTGQVSIWDHIEPEESEPIVTPIKAERASNQVRDQKEPQSTNKKGPMPKPITPVTNAKKTATGTIESKFAEKTKKLQQQGMPVKQDQNRNLKANSKTRYDSLLNELSKNGLDYVDRFREGRYLYILYNPEKKKVFDTIIEKYGLRTQLNWHKTTPKTGGKPAWGIHFPNWWK